MKDESEEMPNGNGNGHSGQPEHVKVSIGISLLVSIGAALLTWGITWGVYSQRLSVQEAMQSRAELELDHNRNTDNQQEAKIAVLGSQYTEIIRRLNSIDAKLDDVT